MAAATVANGLFNAVSFAGASWIFSQFSHANYEKEMKRHNQAMEKLEKDREEVYKEETQRKDRLEELYQKRKAASVDMHNTNQAFEEYHKVENEIHRIEEKNYEEPSLKKYYTPSKEFQHYIVLFNFLLANGVGFLVYKFVL